MSKDNKDNDNKNNFNNKIANFTLYILLILSLIYFFGTFIIAGIENVFDILTTLCITLFTIIFVTLGLKIRVKNKSLFLLSGILLATFFMINLGFKFNVIEKTNTKTVMDLRDKNITEVMKWAAKNNIEVNQEYEYSDMVSEYKIISQNVDAGTKLKDVKNLTVSVSEGPNPYKEIIIPNMLTWDSDRVISFIKSNYLSNVNVEFSLSEEKEDTLIRQDKVGNVKRDEEINLVFSSGEQLNYDEVTLIDFTNKTKFEAIFYLKQHYLNYSIKEDFNDKIIAGNVIAQNVESGKNVRIKIDNIELTISKGPIVKVPDLTTMDITNLTNWVIKNKLKIKFNDKYDDSVKKNFVISANVNKGDVIAQGSVVEVTLSKGPLKMKTFKNLNEFKEWADKYDIKYEETFEFSNSVQVGEVIKYSYKAGEAIKNNDVIIITISDGKEVEVPNIIGLSKKEVENKLDNLGLNYNFVYKASDTIAEGKASKQSISKGAKVSNGTTITITISTGKAKNNEIKTDNQTNSTSDTKNNNKSEQKLDNNTNNDSNEKEEDKCIVKSCTINTSINNIKNNTTGYDYTVKEIKNIMNSQCPGVNYEIVASTDSGKVAGSIVSGIKPGSKFNTCTDTKYQIVIAQ